MSGMLYPWLGEAWRIGTRRQEIPLANTVRRVGEGCTEAGKAIPGLVQQLRIKGRRRNMMWRHHSRCSGL